jgi:hypothetical protein
MKSGGTSSSGRFTDSEDEGEQGGGDAAAGKKSSEQWECNICFEELKIEQSCLTSCGRMPIQLVRVFFSDAALVADLYCWPCLHQWMDTFRDKTTPPVCPVCKNVLNSERIIPIFGRGADTARDPRMQQKQSVPRPVPQREEAPAPQRGFPHFDMRGFGVNFSAGLFGPGFAAFGNAAPMPELTVEQVRAVVDTFFVLPNFSL